MLNYIYVHVLLIRCCLNNCVAIVIVILMIIPHQIQHVTIQFQPILYLLSLPTVYSRVSARRLRMFLFDESPSKMFADLRSPAHRTRQQRGLTSFSLTSKYLLFPKTDDNDILEGNPCRAVYTLAALHIATLSGADPSEEVYLENCLICRSVRVSARTVETRFK